MNTFKVVLVYSRREEKEVQAEDIHEACAKAEQMRKNFVAQSVEVFNNEAGLDYVVKIDDKN